MNKFKAYLDSVLDQPCEVRWRDHELVTDEKAIDILQGEPLVFTSWGKVVGYSQLYLLLCLSFKKDNDPNNDYYRILISDIEDIRVLK